jgi:hypothetical protein
MFGFTGYGTNEYGSSRYARTGPIIRIATTVLRLTFKNITLQL